MVESADERVVLSQSYTPYCMQKRNQYMVDNSDIVIAYIRRDVGGAFKTFSYAKSKNKQIILL